MPDQKLVSFKHVCDNLLGNAQQSDWTLTEKRKELKVVAYYVQELQKRILLVKLMTSLSLFRWVPSGRLLTEAVAALRRFSQLIRQGFDCQRHVSFRPVIHQDIRVQIRADCLPHQLRRLTSLCLRGFLHAHV